MISSPKRKKGQDIEINRWSGDRSRLQRISRQNCGAPSGELSTPFLYYPCSHLERMADTGGRGEDGAAAGMTAEAAEGAEGAATQPKWCEVNTPFMEDQKASPCEA